MELAFAGIGGVQALTKWANDNPDKFYQLWGRLIPQPHEVSGPDGEPLKVVVLPSLQ